MAPSYLAELPTQELCTNTAPRHNKEAHRRFGIWRSNITSCEYSYIQTLPVFKKCLKTFFYVVPFNQFTLTWWTLFYNYCFSVINFKISIDSLFIYFVLYTKCIACATHRSTKREIALENTRIIIILLSSYTQYVWGLGRSCCISENQTRFAVICIGRSPRRIFRLNVAFKTQKNKGFSYSDNYDFLILEKRTAYWITKLKKCFVKKVNYSCHVSAN